MPQEFGLIFQYVKSLKFEDRPDYLSIIEMLETAKERLNLNQSKFDWVTLATDPEAYAELLKNKPEIHKKITHMKIKLTAEETKRFQNN